MTSKVPFPDECFTRILNSKEKEAKVNAKAKMAKC